MAVNIYRNKLKSELRVLCVGESKVIRTSDIPYIYLRGHMQEIAAELGMWFSCHCKKPYDKFEVIRIA